MVGAAATVSINEVKKKAKSGKRSLLTPLNRHRSGELVFAVVGYAGSGTSKVSEMLGGVLKKKGYEPHSIKARPILESVAGRFHEIKPKEKPSPVSVVT